MAATDMLPYVRYTHAGVLLLFFNALVIPFAMLSTTLLYIVGPFGLITVIFFNLSYAALANNYIPTENLLIREEENTAMKLKKGSDIKQAKSNMPSLQMKQNLSSRFQKDAVYSFKNSRCMVRPSGIQRQFNQYVDIVSFTEYPQK